MPSLHVLVVDDELAVRQILATAVANAGYSVDQASTATEAAAKLVRGDVDVALCDIKMPDGNGLDLLRNCRASGIDTIFIMVTAFASMETAIEAIRAGATDYIIKPVHNEEILHRLSQIDSMSELREENRALRRTVSEIAPRLYRFTSPHMLEVDRLVDKVAPADSTVLITGESGTGKGVVAAAIHEKSPRRDGQFVPVNCSAIPEHLLEAEFFGHTKGAFTGADHARKGLFLQAAGGTLFLDEISELPPAMQAKLLNVIEDKAVRPLGSEQARRVNVRIVAATNANLLERVNEGRFREDLYFRLSMFEISIPPLRERQADIPGLIHFLLQGDARRGKGGAQASEIDPAAEEILLAYPWPGNVRELDNVISRARLLAENHRISVGDLPTEITRGASAAILEGVTADADGSLIEQMRRVEADIINRAIDAADGDRKLAAQRLGIGLSSLYRKLNGHKTEPH
jgi:two-component system, NtrC family, response regulator AtoC